MVSPFGDSARALGATSAHSALALSGALVGAAARAASKWRSAPLRNFARPARLSCAPTSATKRCAVPRSQQVQAHLLRAARLVAVLTHLAAHLSDALAGRLYSTNFALTQLGSCTLLMSLIIRKCINTTIEYESYITLRCER